MRCIPDRMAIRHAIAELLRKLRVLRAILKAIERYESAGGTNARK